MLDKFKRSLGVFPWFLRPKFYVNLFFLVFMPRSGKKRVLGVWDYKALPWSLGDPLLFVENLSLLKFEHGAEKIDICIVYDDDNPAGNRGVGVTPENVQDRMIDFLPLFRTCPGLGSIFQFNSRDEFYSFLRSNSTRYEVFPPMKEHLSEKYNFRDSAKPHVVHMQAFYAQHGFIPHLRIGERDLAWARDFFLQQLPKGHFPVVVSMRQPKGAVYNERNADPAVWLAFFDQCAQEFAEVTFVVVGARNEVFPELRSRSNIVIAKDHGTSIMEDLALIRASLMYVGSSSGVNLVAWCSDLPYLIVQNPDLQDYNLKDPNRMGFANEKQRIFGTATAVTKDLLCGEFRNIYGRIDRAEWLKTAQRGDL